MHVVSSWREAVVGKPQSQGRKMEKILWIARETQ